MNGDPLPGRDLALRHHDPEGGAEPAPETRRGDRIDLPRQTDEVHVGVFDRHVLCERAPAGEAGLELAVADVMIAGNALGTRSASTDERQGDPVSWPPPGDVLAGLRDDSRQLV